MWLQRAVVADIVAKVREGSFTEADLRLHAAEDQSFAPKFALVEEALRTWVDPAEREAFEELARAFEAEPYSQATASLIEAYISRWEHVPTASAHVIEARGCLSRSKARRDYEALDGALQALNTGFDDSHSAEAASLLAKVDSYIAKYEGMPHAEAHCKALRARADMLRAAVHELVKSRWDVLFDDKGCLVDFEGMKELLNTFQGLGGLDRAADTHIWNWALEQHDVEAGVEQYMRHYRGFGRHSAQAAELKNAVIEWERVDATNIYDVLEFIEYNPEHIFLAKAAKVVDELKYKEMASLRKAPALFDNATFCTLYNKKVFTKEELMEGAGVDEVTFERIINDKALRRRLPQPPTRSSRYAAAAGEPGILDVIFFGIAASGKTCVLSGILANDAITIDEANWSGEYAALLRRYAREGIAISGTPTDFTAVVKASAHRPDGTVFDFNLVEMAGEAFTGKIVKSSTSEGNLENVFARMDSAAAKILTGLNDKLIFLLIDPNASYVDKQVQAEAFNRLRSLMFDVKENATVMSRVRGINFIVTKADTLPGDRHAAAADQIRALMNSGSRMTFTENCRRFGINQDADGAPKIFTFSLGRFTVGNIYDYNPADSDTLLDVIGKYCPAKTKGSGAERFRNPLRDFLS